MHLLVQERSWFEQYREHRVNQLVPRKREMATPTEKDVSIDALGAPMCDLVDEC
jgi:hypothetical protein